VAKEIDKTFPEDNKLKIRIFRDTHAADETWFYILGLSKEQLNLLENFKKQIDFFNQLRKDASEEAHEIKIEKILKIVNSIDRQKNLEGFIKKVVKELGGLSLPPKILQDILEGVAKRSNKKDNSHG